MNVYSNTIEKGDSTMGDTNNTSKHLITVAGMVGIGKTTFTKALAKCLHYHTSLESVDGNPYLDTFYHDFNRWVFHLQIYFLGERFKEAKRIEKTPGSFIQDRSIYEDTDIFARMHYEKGTMSNADYRTYTSLFEAMVMTPYFRPPDLLIYLYGSLPATLKRIENRGRRMEKKTPVSYWKEMYRRYNDWIDHFQACPVLKINIDEYDLIGRPQSLNRIVPLIEARLSAKAIP